MLLGLVVAVPVIRSTPGVTRKNWRLVVVAVGLLAINLAFPLTVRADQAILTHDALFTLSPGETVEHTDTLTLSRTGIPTVVFDGSSSFADNETVTATITLSTQGIDGLGTVELLSTATLTGVTTATWTADPNNYFTFDPPISMRFTAPSAAALDCTGHPGETFRTHLDVAATLVGSEGTSASFSADDFPSSAIFQIICPAAAQSALPTTPPTDASGTIADAPSGSSLPVWFLVLWPVIAAVVAASLTRRASSDH